MLWNVWFAFDGICKSMIVEADSFDEAIKIARETDDRFCCARRITELG